MPGRECRLCIASGGNRLVGPASCGSKAFRAASSLVDEMLHPAVFSRRAAPHGQILHRHKHRRRLVLPDDRMGKLTDSSCCVRAVRCETACRRWPAPWISGAPVRQSEAAETSSDSLHASSTRQHAKCDCSARDES